MLCMLRKNVCDSLVGTLLNIKGKIKDGLKCRQDLVEMGILVEAVVQLHLTPMVGNLLVSQMLHVEFHPLHVS